MQKQFYNTIAYYLAKCNYNCKQCYITEEKNLHEKLPLHAIIVKNYYRTSHPLLLGIMAVLMRTLAVNKCMQKQVILQFYTTIYATIAYYLAKCNYNCKQCYITEEKNLHEKLPLHAIIAKNYYTTSHPLLLGIMAVLMRTLAVNKCMQKQVILQFYTTIYATIAYYIAKCNYNCKQCYIQRKKTYMKNNNAPSFNHCKELLHNFSSFTIGYNGSVNENSSCE